MRFKTEQRLRAFGRLEFGAPVTRVAADFIVHENTIRHLRHQRIGNHTELPGGACAKFD